MEENVIKMIIYYVLGVYDDDKKTIKSCIEVNKLLIAMVKNEETKADRLLNIFPAQHPVSELYVELRNNDNLLELLEHSKEMFEKSGLDNDCLRNIEDDIEVENLSKKFLDRRHEMEWKYVKSLTDDKSIINIEKKYNVKIPKYLKDIIIQYNGGRPLKNIFNTKNSKEKVFKSLLSYNKEDKENIYSYNEVFHRGYIPFALTPSGDIICIDKENQNIELYLHEFDTFEWVCSDIIKFINSLYVI